MSTARFNTLQNAAGTKSVPVATVVDGSAKAWVNFNGTGIVSVRSSFNVTDITDNGVGDYTVNFTAALADANFAALATIEQSTFAPVIMASDYTTTSVRFRIFADTAGATDRSVVNAAIFR